MVLFFFVYIEGETICFKTLILFCKQYFHDSNVKNRAILIIHFCPHQLHKDWHKVHKEMVTFVKKYFKGYIKWCG